MPTRSCGRSGSLIWCLLVFNLLPIYPLDGGQILRSLLWFVVGRARSLMAATVIGFVGVAGLIILAVWVQSVWFGVIAAFILMNCWSGLQASASAVAFGQVAAPRRVCLSVVQNRATGGSLLEVRPLRTGLSTPSKREPSARTAGRSLRRRCVWTVAPRIP